MKKVEIESVVEFNHANRWCTTNLGTTDNRWDFYPPWFGHGIIFNNTSDYTLFMLCIGTELKSLKVKQ